nr:immunoglobulin heavy chain junction region [Macaca mulatta]
CAGLGSSSWAFDFW